MTTALILTLFTFGFMVYYFSSTSAVLQALAARLAAAGSTGVSQQEALVYAEKAVGFVTLGLIPALVSVFLPGGLRAAGLRLPAGPNAFWWSLLPVLFFAALVRVRPRHRVNTAFYPQVRQNRWDRRRVMRNSFFWCLYLLGYEFSFRGFLFFPLLQSMGLAAAIALNCALYALAHLYKGAGEAFGAFFLGIILCVIAWATGSFVIPLIVHIILALSNDYAAVAAHPEMSFVS